MGKSEDSETLFADRIFSAIAVKSDARPIGIGGNIRYISQAVSLQYLGTHLTRNFVGRGSLSLHLGIWSGELFGFT